MGVAVWPPTASSPRSNVGADVRPFRQIGLADDHGARLPQAGPGRVSVGDVVRQSEAAGGGGQRSSVSILSLISTGIPNSGPRARRIRSSVRAWSRAVIDGDDGVDARVERPDPLQRRLGVAVAEADESKSGGGRPRGRLTQQQGRKSEGGGAHLTLCISSGCSKRLACPCRRR